MTAYTVLSIDDLAMEPLDHCVVGTFATRGRALDECVDYIMERINLRDDLAWAVAHDENHPSSASWMEETAEGWAVADPIALREDIRDELDGSGCYYIWDGESSWHFDIDENDVEGLVAGRATGGRCEDRNKKKED